MDNVEFQQTQLVVISTNEPSTPNSHIQYGIAVVTILGYLKNLHWFSTNYNKHKILDKLYTDLSGLFDAFVEELIMVPVFEFIYQPEHVDFNAFLPDQYNAYLQKVLEGIVQLVQCQGVEQIITDVPGTGLINTRDGIYTAINKAKYLLSQVKE